jgi:probable rRNA maturation factor
MMILLDPELDPESPHGRRPVHGDPDADPAPETTSAKRKAASGVRIEEKEFRLPSARTLSRFLSKAQEAVRLKGQVTVLLTTDAAIRKLNAQFRGKDKATDVLSFPAEGLGAEGIAGDVAISVTTAMGQAAEQGHSLSTEIKVLILHGLLHLAGYDHEADDGKMARRERLLRGRLRLPEGLIERAGTAKQGARRVPEKHPSGAKARIDPGDLIPGINPWPTARTRSSSGAKAQVRTAPFTARLKSCPFKAEARPFKTERCSLEAEPRIFKAEARISKAAKPRAKGRRP